MLRQVWIQGLKRDFVDIVQQSRGSAKNVDLKTGGQGRTCTVHFIIVDHEISWSERLKKNRLLLRKLQNMGDSHFFGMALVRWICTMVGRYEK